MSILLGKFRFWVKRLSDVNSIGRGKRIFVYARTIEEAEEKFIKFYDKMFGVGKYTYTVDRNFGLPNI